jgi:excisionase family DNA binding protein
MNAPSGKTTFTLLEAAELLSCHRETLRRAIRTGELQAAKLGREFRISRPDLQAFWTACGGGDLFGKEEKGEPRAVRKKKGPDRQDNRAVKPERQVQFSLLGAGLEGGSGGDGRQEGAAPGRRGRTAEGVAAHEKKTENDGSAAE